MFSPAGRSSSEHILHIHPSWPFLWRRCAPQICRRGQQGVTVQSLLAQHHLKQHGETSTSDIMIQHQTHKWDNRDKEFETRQTNLTPNVDINVSDHNMQRFLPSIKTALRTANTAPTTMLFWEAARRWRSQDDRIPTEDLSAKSW